MSSFIGFYGQNESLKSAIKNLVSNPDFTFEKNALFLCSEGNPLNTHFHSNSENGSGWVSCGIGITSEASPKILQQEDWIKVFNENVDFHECLNGHFAVIKWNQQEIELYTDQLGMRNIFLHQGKDFVLFSTRLDWMLQLVEKTSINWKRFGSNWLSINPFSSSCFVEGIERLAQGGHAKISNSNVTIENKRWSPKAIHSSKHSVADSLKAFTFAPMNSFSKTSLGLSGGLDSRVLFALLADQKKSVFDLYTFEVEGHPDSEYASFLNEFYGFKHEIIPLEKLSFDQVISELLGITSRTMLTSAIFHIDPLIGYRRLGQQNSITVDGGFGEIARRRYLKGLEFKGKKAVLNKSTTELLTFLSANKADIFSDEIVKEMKIGLAEELSEELEAMPSAKEIGIGNWLDIFSIRSRGQNLSGLNQELVDETLFHIMPFLQPDFLNILLSVPDKERINAKIYREIIHKHAPELSKVPLVKGDDVYPYWMKDISSLAWIKTKQKLGIGYKNTHNIELVLSLKEYIQDTFASAEVIQQPFYDKPKIDFLINNFFNEEEYSLTTQIGWLVSFEAFRKQVY